MFIKIDLNPDQTARLYALMVSDENRDANGVPFFRITKSGSRQGYKDKVEISVTEFLSSDKKDVEDRLAIDSERGEKGCPKEGSTLDEPIPGELLLKIFNAIGRYPFDVNEEKPTERVRCINPNYIPEPPFPIHRELAQLLSELQGSTTDSRIRKVIWWIQGVTSYETDDPKDLRCWLNAKGNDLMAEAAEENPEALKIVGKIVKMFRNREMPAEKTEDDPYVVLSKREIAELITLPKHQMSDLMHWLHRVYDIGPNDTSEAAIEDKTHFRQRGKHLLEAIVKEKGETVPHVVDLINSAMGEHLAILSDES